MAALCRCGGVRGSLQNSHGISICVTTEIEVEPLKEKKAWVVYSCCSFASLAEHSFSSAEALTQYKWIPAWQGTGAGGMHSEMHAWEQ